MGGSQGEQGARVSRTGGGDDQAPTARHVLRDVHVRLPGRTLSCSSVTGARAPPQLGGTARRGSNGAMPRTRARGTPWRRCRWSLSPLPAACIGLQTRRSRCCARSWPAKGRREQGADCRLRGPAHQAQRAAARSPSPPRARVPPACPSRGSAFAARASRRRRLAAPPASPRLHTRPVARAARRGALTIHSLLRRMRSSRSALCSSSLVR